MSELRPIDLQRRSGEEPFHDEGRPLGFDLLSFWQWTSSDLMSNTTRGIVAEYLVAQALGIAKDSVRDEWAAYDLKALDRTRVEVKSAAYIQSWHQDKLSRITFNVRRTRAWDKYTGRLGSDVRRHADVYVFALLAHADQSTIDLLNVSQWEFFVLPTVVLDQRKRSQHSITLPSLRKACGDPVKYSGLAHAIRETARLTHHAMPGK